jgi:carboxyl-terminal processing protease
MDANGAGEETSGSLMRRVTFGGLVTVLAGLSVAVLAEVWADVPKQVDTGQVDTGFSRVDNLAHINGVWRSRGYGWVWAVADGHTHTYDQALQFCIETAAYGSVPANGVVLSADGRTMHVRLGDPTYYYTFDKISALPKACLVKLDKSPSAILAALEDIFSAHYAFFKERSVDWPAIVAVARGKISEDTSKKALLKIVVNLLRQIDDDHVSLVAKIGRRTRVFNTGAGRTLRDLARQAQTEKEDFNDLLGCWKRKLWTKDFRESLFGNNGRKAAGGLIRYGLIEDDIGFLSVQAMSGFADGEAKETAAVDDAMDAVMTYFATTKAVIVDVSVNDGGYDSVARKIASHFAAKKTLAYSKYARDDPGAKSQVVTIEPSASKRYLGPVYLLTSDVTVSAAEVFTLAMRAMPNVTHVGETTRGSLSDALWKRLPNKWSVSLSNEVYLDSDGKLWEGNGIPPQIAFPVFAGDDPQEALLGAIRGIVQHIRSQSIGGGS